MEVFLEKFQEKSLKKIPIGIVNEIQKLNSHRRCIKELEDFLKEVSGKFSYEMEKN